jgi:hypothetical protein
MRWWQRFVIDDPARPDRRSLVAVLHRRDLTPRAEDEKVALRVAVKDDYQRQGSGTFHESS